MSQTKNDFLILYGSQTGQAQSISEEIFDQAHKKGFNPRRFCLSLVEKKVWQLYISINIAGIRLRIENCFSTLFFVNCLPTI